MPKIIFSLLFLLSLAFNHSSILADEVTIVSDRWPPYNGTPNSPAPGYVIEIAEYSLAKAGHTIHYQLWSWEKSIKLVNEGKRDCLIGDHRSSIPNYYFPELHVGVDQTVFVVRKGFDWRYTGMSSLAKIRIGNIYGYQYTPDMHQYIQSQPGNLSNTKGKYAIESNLSALINGQLDAVIESKNVLLASLKKQDWLDEVEFAGNVTEHYKIHFACTASNPAAAEYVRLITEGLTELRQTGQLNTILKKYGLADWQGLPAIDN